MNAKEFFEQYSIEIINKRTRISPISIRFIKNREFDKLTRVKFIGFIRLIEKEFKVDLQELIDDYNAQTGFQRQPEETVQLKEPKKHNTLILFILALILFLLGAYLLYNKYNTPPSNIIKTGNQTELTQYQTDEINYSDTNKTQAQNSQTKIEQDTNITENNTKEQTVSHPRTVIIIPNEKVWFKAVNTDNNKTEEYLTTHSKTLIGPDWYVKFGHGNITILYGDKTITPDTKKVLRILFKDGNVTYMKKPNKYEK
jgi:cytoskeletal protein RodZ